MASLMCCISLIMLDLSSSAFILLLIVISLLLCRNVVLVSLSTLYNIMRFRCNDGIS